jgi:glycosyltransferase involved in cell wall biosynthesis
MYRPLVSVITPTYNNSRYIGATIESLLAQRYGRWELVVVDDGSTDNTQEVVERFEDRRIRYVKQERRGVARLASTINNGLGMVSGELVTMFGSDDLWPPDRLELQVPVFEDPSVVLCFGRGVHIDAEGKPIGEIRLPRGMPFVVNRPVGSVLHSLLEGNWLPQYTVLIRRKDLEALGGYLQPPPLLAEDYPTHLALALRGEFRYLDNVLGYYRMHNNQATRNLRMEMAKTDVEWVRGFYRGLDPVMKARAGWTEEALDKALRRRLNNAHFEEGRRRLILGDRRAAWHHFLTALQVGAPSTKAKAAVGLACSAVGTDMEGIVRLLGRTPLR